MQRYLPPDDSIWASNAAASFECILVPSQWANMVRRLTYKRPTNRE